MKRARQALGAGRGPVHRCRDDGGAAARADGLGRAGLRRVVRRPRHGDTWSATEPLHRDFFDAGGATSTSSCFRLSVDKHTDMQDHERITVTWSGAHVTGGRSLNPYGESGLPQEYPVVLMECRGVDPKNYADGTVPSGHEAVTPRTCWTNTYFQRTNSASPGEGIWEQDATGGDSAEHLQGIDPGDVPDSCNVNDNFDYSITPFTATDGTLYAGCSSQSMPPEATVNSVSIPNEVYAFTDTDGRGTFPFEVRTALENQSLGCSSTVPCTLEVIPIDGINCDNPDPAAACNQVGDLPPGKVNNGQAPQDAVAPGFWTSASNWDRRVPVPLDFSPPRQRVHGRQGRQAGAVLRLGAARPDGAAVGAGVLPEQEAVQLAGQRDARRRGVRPDAER